MRVWVMQRFAGGGFTWRAPNLMPFCFAMQTYADKHAPALFYGDDESPGALCS